MQPLPNEPSEDDREWNPNEDPEFERDNKFGGPNAFDQRNSNPIFENNSMSQSRPISQAAHEFNNNLAKGNLNAERRITDEDERQSLVKPKNLFGT